MLPIPPVPVTPAAPPDPNAATQVNGAVSVSPAPSGVPNAPIRPVAKPKIGVHTLGFFGALLLIILILAAAGAVAVAKTGLVHIPFASLLYRGPTPTRLVQTAPVEPNVFLQQVSDKVNAVIQQGGMPPYRVLFNEVELTGALQGAVQSAMRNSDVRVDQLQLAVTPPYLELYGRMHNSSVTVTTLVQLVPKIENGELLLEPISVQVGDYTIPTSTARELAGSLLSRDFGAWKLNAGEMTLEDIRVKDAGLELTLSGKR